MFKVATKFRSLYFIILTEEFPLRDLFILGRGLRNYLAVSSITMESLPLKDWILYSGLRRPTGPSSGAVVCILLDSSRWE